MISWMLNSDFTQGVNYPKMDSKPEKEENADVKPGAKFKKSF